MANEIRIKRRASGAAGAPAGLKNAEIAYNEVDDTLYYGKGTTGGGDDAATIIAIGGNGSYVALTGNQTVAGVKTFSSPPKSVDPVDDADLTTKEWVLDQIGQGGGGSVTSIGISVPTGLSVANSPITSAGTIAISYASGYQGFTTAQSTKLAGIAANATANDTDANLRNRANHTGTQAIGTVTGLQAALDGKINVTEKGAANGVPTLGIDGKIPTNQLPDSVLGGMTFECEWDADENDPPIPAAAAGNKGHYYIVSVAGDTEIDGVSDWHVGDWIVSNGTAWVKIDNTDIVVSVNGKIGAVVIDVEDLPSAGTMASQNANSAAITGGSIDGITIDGGTF